MTCIIGIETGMLFFLRLSSVLIFRCSGIVLHWFKNRIPFFLSFSSEVHFLSFIQFLYLFFFRVQWHCTGLQENKSPLFLSLEKTDQAVGSPHKELNYFFVFYFIFVVLTGFWIIVWYGRIVMFVRTGTSKNNSERPVDGLAENGKLLSYWQLEIKRC